MKYEQYLTTGKTVPVSITGRYIHLSKGEEVQVIANGRTMDIYRGFTFDVESEFTELVITQNGVDGNIELLCSDVPFTAGVDGSKLNINADLSIEDFEVHFGGHRQPVELDPEQKVKTEVTNWPNEQKVNVVNMPQTPEVQKVHVVGEDKSNLRFIPKDTMTKSGTITGNASRAELIIKAADGNSQSLWLGGYAERGYELRAGEAFVLTNGAEMDVLIPTDCKLYVSEVTA
ncbi:hypothetical protein [Vibrio sp. SCSIO 43137]|uniref:hypothetical protein n=1 Tax=Vibrio sp. SCSIO 43137 TaxID=3021011 RepID=UPI002306FC98|nr:hypothetical protein [Vibrio sp. SCSIO 43137]WCE29971.1 hypothetical protein PK654_01270 [Vibrio sp. SCSIO 43137]